MSRSEYHYHNHNSQSYSEITEKRAPTDESVRLLKEMESEAKNKVIEAIVVNNTEFECAVHKLVDPINDRELYRFIYTMNGKKSSVDIAIKNWPEKTVIDKMMYARDELAKDIANKMIDSVIRAAETRNVFTKRQY